MYYSAGNYEAFATPKKPANVDGKSAYIVGSGLAALSAACYLVRDAQMKGEHVHILEKDPIPGGACDGYHYENLGYVMRGGREMDNHFECMWDLFRSIPSIEDENHTVLDEYYWLNKADPNYSLCRATRNRGEDAHTDGKFGLSDKACGLPVFRIIAGKTLSDGEVTDLLVQGRTGLLKGFQSKQGNGFEAVIAFDADFNTTFVFPEKKRGGKRPQKRK